MSKPGPETKLVAKMRKAGREKYGARLVDIKYHGSQFGETGVSDTLHCLDGVFVAIEAKAPESYRVKGQPSVEKALRDGPTAKQRAFVDRVNEAGGVGGFAADIEGYMDLLAQAELKSIRGVIY